MAAAVLVDERALILGPPQIGAQMSRLLTGAGFVCLCTDDATRLGEWLAEGVGLLIAADSTLPTDPQSPVQLFIDQQPEWSDLPVLLLLDPLLPATGSPSSRLGNLLQLQLPIDDALLIRMSQVALHTRRRQYLARDRLWELQQRLEDQLQQHQAEDKAWRQTRKMDAVGQLAGGIAHDFNNLLTSIGGSFELIDKRLRQGRTEQLEALLRMGREAVARAIRLTHQLLAFSSRQSLQRKIVDLHSLLKPQTLQAKLSASVTLRVNLPANLWLAEADDKQLREVLDNVVLNACEAMPSGGQLSIEASNEHIDDTCFSGGGLARGDYLRLSIRDNGQGMSQSTLEHAFEPFFSTKPTGQGIGLGLSMVYGFSKQSHGHVALHSQIGQGTQVDLYLPRYRGQPKPKTDAHPAKAASGNRNVLIVEDDPHVRDLVSQALREEGFPCQAACNADEALQLLNSPRPYALLVSDVGLPGMNGRQLAQIARKRRPGLQVLFITGYAETAMARDDFLDPGMQLICKPFELSQLQARVAQMLGEA
ncbi:MULTISPECIES: ATP-binding protein [Pseudomonas]|uniref:histidine kinase n=1 Tax=Pseudomonas putida TaxID=303 RepID=A0A1B2F4Z3_PSEPU|nr:MULTISPECIES: ATP-binding protein [Pseudomonas]ANY87348.1 Blue-light-activated protein [Pseudomonas putida]MCL8305079.1 ATP-binding protein [Pseudomonas putida]